MTMLLPQRCASRSLLNCLKVSHFKPCIFLPSPEKTVSWRTTVRSSKIEFSTSIGKTLRFRNTFKRLSFLATVSYSLYLVHPLFLERTENKIDMSAHFSKTACFICFVITPRTVDSHLYTH